MPKKRIDLPPIDFTNDDNAEWINRQIKNHPEIIAGAMFQKTADDLSRTSSGELEVVSKPGKPKKANNKIDWDAWYLYYNISILWGFQTSYENIANLVDRSPITVKQNFIRIGHELTGN